MNLSYVLPLAASLVMAADTGVTKPTFSKDVAPIINNRCLECHRSGEVAPMAFSSYSEVRPWAKAIKEKVVSRTMPPWLADPAHGSFSNDRRLSSAEIETVVAWVNAGAPEGDPHELPPAPKFAMGWQIAKPDQIIDIGTDFDVPAQGVVPYKYFRVPSGFTEDKWIQAAEIRPGNRASVHHIIVFVQEPGDQNPVGGEGGSLLTGYAPGEQALIFEPGTAKLVKAGSTFIFQVHYTPSGKAYTDRSYVGLKFATTPVENRALTGRALNFALKIPPGDPNYEVKSSWVMKQDVELSGFMPHMHLRGKDFKYTVTYPDGRQEVVLDVPRYDFNWQLNYTLKTPLSLPKGSRIDCVAHFDNSANNRFNPDPTKEVH